MKVIKYQLLLAVALLVGVAIGYFLAPTQSAAEVSAEPMAASPDKALAARPDAAELARLRARVTEMNDQMRSRHEWREEPSALPTNELAQAQQIQPPPRPRDRLEDLKNSDPARYAQITNRFAQFRRARLAHVQAKVDFLSSLNTSTWSESAQQTHDEVLDLMAKREELEETMHQEDLTEEQRRQCFDDLRKTDRALRKANQAERANLISEVARSMGLDEGAAEEFTRTLYDVYEATDASRHGPPGPPFGGGGAQPPPQ